MIHLANLKNKYNELTTDYLRLLCNENVINFWDDEVQFYITRCYTSILSVVPYALPFKKELNICSDETKEQVNKINEQLDRILYEINSYTILDKLIKIKNYEL